MMPLILEHPMPHPVLKLEPPFYHAEIVIEKLPEFIRNGEFSISIEDFSDNAVAERLNEVLKESITAAFQ